jgi:hypothetical protein
MIVFRIIALVTLMCAVGRAAGPTTAPAAPNIEDLLDRRFSEVSFDGTPLDKALDILREPLKANIVVNWATVHTAGVEPSTPVKLHLWHVTLRQALTVLLTVVGDGREELGYRVGDNVITITIPRFDPPPGESMKVYDVRDLLDAAIARRKAAPLGPNSNQTSPAPEPDESEELCKLIVETVDPYLWDRGAGPGIVRAWSGRLVVINSPVVQNHVAEFLAKLRRTPPTDKSGEAK